MNADEQQPELESKVSNLRIRVSKLREKVESLTNAATKDMLGKVDELDTMIAAAQRDAREAPLRNGAEIETARKLYAVTESKLSSLEHEIEALATGNPTTISAAVDAIANLGKNK